MHRAGTTLFELIVVLVVIALMAAISFGRLREAMDRAAARGAIQEAGSIFSLARRAAVTRRAVVGVVIDTVGGVIMARAAGRVIGQQNLRARYGVRLGASRDSMAYDPRGLGYGAANLTVVARRGRGAETLFVSRLGRTRR
jgi:type II secretory pathway pseudopilin PulG